MTQPRRMFAISGNNKGLRCPFKPIICEEGYCRDCQIYLDWQERKPNNMRNPDKVSEPIARRNPL